MQIVAPHFRSSQLNVVHNSQNHHHYLYRGYYCHHPLGDHPVFVGPVTGPPYDRDGSSTVHRYKSHDPVHSDPVTGTTNVDDNTSAIHR